MTWANPLIKIKLEVIENLGYWLLDYAADAADKYVVCNRYNNICTAVGFWPDYWRK